MARKKKENDSKLPFKIPKIRQLDSGNYTCQLRIGGESYSITKVTEAEVYAEVVQIKSDYLTNHKKPKRVTVNSTLTEAIDGYIRKRSSTVSPLTIRGYRIIQKGRFQDIMNRPIYMLMDPDKTDWQQIVNDEAGKKDAEGNTVAPKTLRNAWGFIRSVIKETASEYPPKVQLPVETSEERPFLTPDQIKTFVAAVATTQYAVPALLALSSLRASEIEALRWENIPEDPDFIHVAGAVVQDENNNWVTKKANKNKSSNRNVPIMIPELKAAIKRDRKDAGPVMAFRQNSLRYGIAKICEENDLPDVGIHGLRHSFASLAYHLQIPEKIAMEIGGWSDARTMTKIYTHVAQSDISRYQNAMMDFFKKPENPAAADTQEEGKTPNANGKC